MKMTREQAFIAALALIGLPAAAAYGYQPAAQVVITDAENRTATLTTREHFFSTPKVEKVLIAQRPHLDNVLFCRHGGYPSVQYHCRSTYYGQAAHFDRKAVGVQQTVRLAWSENLTNGSWI
ncbi:hypothetical protein BH11PAT2_BH11PAT2_00500 [soil metagenome]